MSIVDKLTKFKEAGIKLKSPNYSNSVEIIIVGDFNDLDLVTKITFVSVDEFVEIFPVLHKIKKYGNDNWEKRKKYLREEEIELVDGYHTLIPESHQYDQDIYELREIKCYFRCSDGFRYKIEL